MRRKPKYCFTCMALLLLVLASRKSNAEDIEEEEEDSTETPSLVKYGHFCKQPPEFDVDGLPQTTPAPFDLEIFTLPGESSVNTLQLVLRPKGITFHYMVMQAVNENGVPVGQFHHFPCSNAATQTTYKPSGINRIMNYCTMQKYAQDPLNKKYGNTNFVYTIYRPEEGHLEDAMVFWSWPSHLGRPAPSKIQFHYAAIKENPEAEDTYWLMHSPVITFNQKFIYKEPADFGSAKDIEVACYTQKLSDTVEGNLFLTKDNSKIPVNKVFFEEVVGQPFLATIPTATTPTTTTPTTTTPTTTTPTTTTLTTTMPTTPVTRKSTLTPILLDGIPTLVKYQASCKAIDEFQVDGIPQEKDPPIDIKLYEIMGDTNAYTLAIMLVPKKGMERISIQYLVIQALNENGVPAGFFHHKACMDPNKKSHGLRYVDQVCSGDPDFNQKWGITRVAYIAANKAAGHEALADESIFWSWSPREGKPPAKIQFKVAAIQKIDDNGDLFWVGIHSGVIDLRDKIKWQKPDDIVPIRENCYANILNENSIRNFILSKNQDEIPMNKEFLEELYRHLPTTASIASTTTSIDTESTPSTSTEATTLQSAATESVSSTSTQSSASESLSWPTVKPPAGLPTLVSVGAACAPARHFGVNGIAQTSPPPVTVKVYEILGDGNSNTLSILVERQPPLVSFEYLMIIAVNEDGIPTGHFGNIACPDPNSKMQGSRQIDQRCTKDPLLIAKYGETRFAYMIPNIQRGFHSLGDESFFWLWSGRDGPRPSKIQFRLTLVNKLHGEDDLYWTNIVSPVIELGVKIPGKRKEDFQSEIHPCYKNIVTTKSERNFVVSSNQTDIRLAQDFLADLYPELRKTTTTIPTTAAPSTSVSPTSTTDVSITEWPTIPPVPGVPTLVRQRAVCSQIRHFEVQGNSQSSTPPVTLKIYEMMGDGNTNTVAIFIERKLSGPTLKYLVIIALDERGVPVGHFNNKPCPDPNLKMQGYRQNGQRCSSDPKISEKYGQPRFSYVIPNIQRGFNSLGDESFFWTWNPKDGHRPSKIQFRLSVVESSGENSSSEIYWSNILSPVLEFQDKLEYKEPSDYAKETYPCYKNVVTAKSERNFVLSNDQEELIMSEDFIADLYPELRTPATSTTESPTESSTEFTSEVSERTTEREATSVAPEITMERESSPTSSTITSTVTATTTSAGASVCAEIKEFRLEGFPEDSPAPVKLQVYEILGDGNVNFLTILAKPSETNPKPYEYLAIIALNENGVPVGHFGNKACPDLNSKMHGRRQLGLTCSEDAGLKQKYGPTRYAYTIPNEKLGFKNLNEESFFWMWNPKDGNHPQKIQFKVTVVHRIGDTPRHYQHWVVSSPVIEFQDNIEWTAYDDFGRSTYECYVNMLAKTSERNFVISEKSADIKMSEEFLKDLRAMSKTETTVTAAATTTTSSTTISLTTNSTEIATTESTEITTWTPKGDSSIPESTSTVASTEAETKPIKDSTVSATVSWPTVNPPAGVPTLAVFGAACSHVTHFAVNGIPQTSPPPVTVKVYEILGDGNSNTLSVLVERQPPPISFEYLMIIAVNQDGIPTGHFGNIACPDPNSKMQGSRQLDQRCTKNPLLIAKYGDTRFAYMIPNIQRGFHSLGDESFFWLWSGRDGPRPSKIQFRLTLVNKLHGEDDLYWTNIVSPVIELGVKIPGKRKEDFQSEIHPCYKNIVTTKSERNFVVSTNQTSIPLAKDFLIDLYPELAEPSTTTTAATSSASTSPVALTTEAEIGTWPTIFPVVGVPTLVREGAACSQIKHFEVQGDPQTTPPPITLRIFEILGDGNSNSLSILIERKPGSGSFGYLVIIALNENGVPVGYFSNKGCPDPNTKMQGSRQINQRCTTNPEIVGKYGKTRYAHIIPNLQRGFRKLGDESIFWSWSPKDGQRPKKIQFIVSVVMNGEGNNKPDTYWSQILSPVIDFQDKIPWKEPTDMAKEMYPCYKHVVTEKSERNFVLSEDQKQLVMNQDFLALLYPELRKATMETTESSTETSESSTGTSESSTETSESSTETSESSAETTEGSTATTKTSTEASESSTESTESSTETSESSTETTKGSIGTSETSTATTETSTEASESSTETIQSSTETVESSTETIASSTGTSESSTETSESSTETSESSTETSESSTETSESSTKTTESSTKTTESSTETSESSVETSESFTETTKTSTESTEISTETTETNGPTETSESVTMPTTSTAPTITDTTVLSTFTSTEITPWPTIAPVKGVPTLVRQHVMCAAIKHFEVQGLPQNSAPPVSLKIFQNLGKGHENTLSIVATPEEKTTFHFQYLVIIALNENGIPIGYFSNNACPDPNVNMQGERQLRQACTLDPMLKQKYGPTRFAYIIPRPGFSSLLKESFFWGWNPSDGAHPQKVQFIVTAVHEKVKNDEYKYWNVWSPVIEFKEVVKLNPPDDLPKEKYPCYKNIITTQPNRNFAIAGVQTKLAMNKEFLEDLYPELREPTDITPEYTTVLTTESTNPVTTTVLEISQTALSSATPTGSTAIFTTTAPPGTTTPVPIWPTIAPVLGVPNLVRQGATCNQIKHFEVKGLPSKSPEPVNLKVYEIMGDSNAYTLSVFIAPTPNPNLPHIQYLVIVALNEDGVPVGHFGNVVCPDPNANRHGSRQLNQRCTENKTLVKQYGQTRFAYMIPDIGAGFKTLNEESFFWIWNPVDDRRPSKLQFKLTAIRKLENGDEGHEYWILPSPVIEFKDKIKWKKPEDLLDTKDPCYKNVLTAQAERNFVLAQDQSEIRISEDFLGDLYPELKKPTTTTIETTTPEVEPTETLTSSASTELTLSSTMTTTTSETSSTRFSSTALPPTFTPIPQWPTIAPLQGVPTLVRHGATCNQIKHFEVKGLPSKPPEPVNLKVYEMMGDSNAYTLSVLIGPNSNTKLLHIQYLVIVALNEEGIPVGHFGNVVCPDPNANRHGRRQLNQRCTEDKLLINKHGNTRFAYMIPDVGAGFTTLNEESFFWIWNPVDDRRPSKLQFKLTAIRKLENGDEGHEYWILSSPVIEFRDKVPWKKHEDFQSTKNPCYKNILRAQGERNFVVAQNQTRIMISEEFLADLYPELRKSTTETPTTPPTITTASPTVPSSSTIELSTSMSPKGHAKFTSFSHDADGGICTSSEQFEVEGDPLTTTPPVTVKLFEILGDENADVLTVLLKRQTNETYHYVSITAFNENGIPSGHFGNKACPDPNAKMKGKRLLNEECTDDPELIQMFGHTRFASIIPNDNIGSQSLDQESVFWFWSPKDGPRPKKIQFKVNIVRDTGKESQPKEHWIGIRSFLVNVRERVKAKVPDDRYDGNYNCYEKELSEDSDRNFYFPLEQSGIGLNRTFLETLFKARTSKPTPGPESSTTSSITIVTTPEPNTTIIYQTSNATFTTTAPPGTITTSLPVWSTIEPVQGVPTLVRQGATCNQIKHFEVKGPPSKSPEPVNLKVYEIMGDSNAYTLSVFIAPTPNPNLPPIQYLVIVALNEDGVPVGHFGNVVCPDPNANRHGRRQLNQRCTEDKPLVKKYGHTRFAYMIPDIQAGFKTLNEESFFWIWNPVDDRRPSKLQFKITAIRNLENGDEGHEYWILPSPVIEFKDKIKWKKPEDLLDTKDPCYKNVLTAQAERNFVLAQDQSEIRMNEGFLGDLYPEFRKPTTAIIEATTPIATDMMTSSTSTEVTLPPSTTFTISMTSPGTFPSTAPPGTVTPVPVWPTIAPVQGVPTLVRQGAACNQIKHFEVKGEPSKPPEPVDLKVYEILGDSNAYTLSVFIGRNANYHPEPFQYLVIIALNEDGVPVGHFANVVCPDPNPNRHGRRQLNQRCTEDKSHIKKYETTRFAYMIPDIGAGFTTLNEESFFWTWNPVDGRRPSKLQFIVTAVQELKGSSDQYEYWLLSSSVIEFRDKVSWKKHEDFQSTKDPCYKNILTAQAERNFVLAQNQTRIMISEEFLADLYPELRKSTTETPTAPPTITTASPTVPSSSTIELSTSMSPKGHAKFTSFSHDADGGICTSSEQFEVEGDPLTTTPPVTVKLFEILGDENADVLTVLLKRQTNETYHYVSITAFNENGIPSGHFGNKACPDPNAKMKGKRLLNEECTDDPELIQMFGHTRFASIIPNDNIGSQSLDQESVFWFWSPKDGPRPKKIQFKVNIVRDTGKESQPKEHWIGIRSFLVNVRERVKAKVPDDRYDGNYNCYEKELSEDSDRNFYFPLEQSGIGLNRTFLETLFKARTSKPTPGPESSTTSSITIVTTPEPNTTIIYQTSNATFTTTAPPGTITTSLPVWSTIAPVQGVPTLVRQGATCNQIKHFEVKGLPSKSPEPVNLKVYEIMGDSNAYTLSVFIAPTPNANLPPIQYLIIVALNQDGVPVGHFGNVVCPDPNPNRHGRRQLNQRCTENNLLIKKYGNTRFAYMIPDVGAGFKALKEESFFWIWNPVDDHLPSKLQFRVSAVHELEDGKDYDYWILSSPLIEVRDKLKWKKPEDVQSTTNPCYKNILTTLSERNFVLAQNQSQVKMSEEFLGDLYPELKPSTPETTKSPHAPFTSTASNLVQLKGSCKRIEQFEVNGQPQSTPPPVELKIYEIEGESNVNTLSLLLKRNTTLEFEYMVILALSEAKAPCGHFINQPCPDASDKVQGQHFVLQFCSQESKFPKQSGKSRMAYAVPDTARGFSTLGDETFFWTWDAQDGPRPKKINFQVTVIHKAKDGDDIFWIGVMSPEITFKKEFEWKPPDYSSQKINKCYQNEFSALSYKNFQIALADVEPVPIEKKTIRRLEATTSTPAPKTVSTRAPRDGEVLDPTEYFPTPSPPDAAPDEISIYRNCNNGKHCLEDVPGCVGARRCQMLATFTRNHDQTRDYFRVELMAKIPKGYGYVAIGLSTDSKMGDDSVVECVLDSHGRSGVYMSYNSGYQNYRLSKTSCTELSRGPLTHCNITVADGKLLCNFYRRNYVKVGERVFDVLNIPYHIHRASGHKVTDFRAVSRKRRHAIKRDVSESERDSLGTAPFRENATTLASIPIDGHIGHHDKAITSDKPIFLNEVDKTDYNYEEVRMIKLHGVFMILAFIALVPNAAFLSRYFKESYRRVFFFGVPVWKVGHIGLISLASCFLLLGMVTIWWYDRRMKEGVGYSPQEYRHMAVGYTVFVLFGVQVLIGAFGGLRRIKSPSTDVLHFAVGTIAYIMALVIIGLGHRMSTSFFHCYDALLIIIWTIWTVLWHVIISVHLHIQDRDLGLKTWRAFLPFPFPVLTRKKVKGEFFRLNAFVFHAAGSGIVAVLLVVPYLYSRGGCLCTDGFCW